MKKSVFLFVILTFVLVACGCGETPEPTPIPYAKEDAVISFQADFDDRKDLNYFDILSHFDEDGNDYIVDPSDAKLEDGAFYFGEAPVRGANLEPFLNYETALHLRWKTTTENTCYDFPLMGLTMSGNSMQQFHAVGLGSCSNQALMVEYPAPSGQVEVAEESTGYLINTQNQWIEAVFWIENPESPRFYVLAWDSENPSIYYLAKSDLPMLTGARQFLFSFDNFEGEVAIDFLKIINGDVESYLWFNAPPFVEKFDILHDFLNSDIQSPLITIDSESDSESENEMDLTFEGDILPYKISFQADFDDRADLNYFSILSHFDEDGNDYKVNSSDAKLEQGAFYFGEYPVRGANLNPFIHGGPALLSYGTALHLRWKITAEETCYVFGLLPLSMQDSQAVGLSTCSYDNLRLEYPGPFEQVEVDEEETGFFLFNTPNQWIEAVFWIENPESPRFYAVAWDSENPSTYYLAKSDFLPTGSDAQEFLFCPVCHGGEVAVDFLKIIDGDIESYLQSHAPPAVENPDDVHAFLNSGIRESNLREGGIYLEFDNVADLNHLMKFFEAEYVSGEHIEQPSGEDFLHDGSLRLLGDTNIDHALLRRPISMGDIVHLKTCSPPPEDVPAFSYSMHVSKDTDPECKVFSVGNNWSELYNLAIDLNVDNQQLVSLQNLSEEINAYTSGCAESVSWFSPEGDKLFVFVNSGEKLAYYSLKIPPDWQTEEAMLSIRAFGDTEYPYLDVDFIRIEEGSLKDYLAENLPAYLENQVEVDAFLEAEPQEFPRLLPPPEDEQ